jgi:hypothetical protein
MAILIIDITNMVNIKWGRGIIAWRFAGLPKWLRCSEKLEWYLSPCLGFYLRDIGKEDRGPKVVEINQREVSKIWSLKKSLKH